MTALKVLPSARAVSSASRASSGGSEIVFLTAVVAIAIHTETISKNNSYQAETAQESG